MRGLLPALAAWWALGCAEEPPPDEAPLPEDTACPEQVATFVDGDGDGYGDPATFASRCRPGAGRVLDATDCDDARRDVNPAARERCDGVDDDCSGAPDEPWDRDGDGASTCMDDCDDGDPYRSPLLAEVCDGRDNDCDADTDEGFDVDGDGVATCRGDCNDLDAAVNPLQPEVCDGKESDCDPTTDEDGDLDADGATWCDGDCDDTRATVGPGEAEVCDGLDNDCDGFADNTTDCYGCAQEATYLYCEVSAPFEVAEAACASSGGHLVYMDSGAENTAVSTAAAAYSGGGWWIGLTDRAQEGRFVWLDGRTPSPTFWWPGEPNDAGGEDCAGTNFGGLGRWNDYACGTTLPFICER